MQETFLAAHRSFTSFRGGTEREFVAWLGTIFSLKIAMLLRRYVGTQQHDVRREHALQVNLDQTSQLLERGLQAKGNSPSQSMMRRE